MTVIVPPMTSELEAAPGPVEAATGDPGQHLVAAWLLGYQSPANRRNYALDITAWLGFCDGHGIDPLAARRVHVDAWARTMQSGGAASRTLARRLAAASSWYRYLAAEGVRTGSPLEHVRRPKIADRGETPGLTVGELRRLLTATEVARRRNGSSRSPRTGPLSSARWRSRLGAALSRTTGCSGSTTARRSSTCLTRTPWRR